MSKTKAQIPNEIQMIKSQTATGGQRRMWSLTLGIDLAFGF
jgi:hypothetical protein